MRSRRFQGEPNVRATPITAADPGYTLRDAHYLLPAVAERGGTGNLAGGCPSDLTAVAPDIFKGKDRGDRPPTDRATTRLAHPMAAVTARDMRFAWSMPYGVTFQL